MFPRNSKTARFIIPCEGVDDAAVKLGLAWLKEMASQSGKRGLVIVAQKSNAESLDRIWGAAATRALLQGSPVSLGEGAEFELRTMRQLNFGEGAGRSSPSGLMIATSRIWMTDLPTHSA